MMLPSLVNFVVTRYDITFTPYQSIKSLILCSSCCSRLPSGSPTSESPAWWAFLRWDILSPSVISKSLYFTSLLPSCHFYFTSKPHTFDFIKTKYLPTLLHFYSTSSQANYFSAAPVVAIISLAQHIKQSQPFCSFCCSRVTTSSSHQYQNFFCISCCSWVPIIELDKLKFEIIFPQLVL